MYKLFLYGSLRPFILTSDYIYLHIKILLIKRLIRNLLGV